MKLLSVDSNFIFYESLFCLIAQHTAPANTKLWLYAAFVSSSVKVLLNKQKRNPAGQIRRHDTSP